MLQMFVAPNRNPLQNPTARPNKYSTLGGEAGHLARDCTQNAGGPTGSGMGGGSGWGSGGGGGYGGGPARECYRCGGTGHIAR